jgi:hypothetical protein
MRREKERGRAKSILVLTCKVSSIENKKMLRSRNLSLAERRSRPRLRHYGVSGFQAVAKIFPAFVMWQRGKRSSSVPWETCRGEISPSGYLSNLRYRLHQKPTVGDLICDCPDP